MPTDDAGEAPRTYAWIIPRRLAVAERLGGGGRSHRRARREAEERWWARQGATTIVSAKESRHGLTEHALAGFRIAWHPLRADRTAGPELRRLVAAVERRLREDDGGVVVCCDRPGEWLCGIDAALRLGLGMAPDARDALRQAREDGLPAGPLARRLVRGFARAAVEPAPPGARAV